MVPIEALFKCNLDELRFFEQRLLIRDENHHLPMVTLLKQFAEENSAWVAYGPEIYRWINEHNLEFTLVNLRSALTALQTGEVDVEYLTKKTEESLRARIAETKVAYEKAQVLIDIASKLKATLETEFRKASDQGFHVDWQELKRLKDEIHYE
jgi:hypothetical protein